MANHDNDWYGNRRNGYAPSSQATDDDYFFEARDDDDRRQGRYSQGSNYGETHDRRYSESFRSPRNERFEGNTNYNARGDYDRDDAWRPYDPDSDDWYAGSSERFQQQRGGGQQQRGGGQQQRGGVQQGGYPNTSSDYYRQTTRQPRHDYRRPTDRGYAARDTGAGYASFERHRSGHNYSGSQQQESQPHQSFGNAGGDYNAYGDTSGTSGTSYRHSMNDVRQSGASTYARYDEDRYEHIGQTYDQPENSFRGRGPKNWKRSPDRIREEVCERLTHDHRLDAYHIEIEADEDGIVTLTGSVSDRRAKRRAESLCDGIRGVRDVRNRLDIDDDLHGRDLSQANAYQTAGETGNTARTSKEIEGKSSSNTSKESGSKSSSSTTNVKSKTS